MSETTEQRREEAVAVSRELDKLTDRGVNASVVMGARLKAKGVNLVAKGYDYTPALTVFLEDFFKLMQDALVCGHLTAVYRTVRRARVAYVDRINRFGAYDGAIGFLRKRTELTPVDIEFLREKYGAVALEVTKNLGAVVEEKAMKAVKEIIHEGLHITEAKQVMRHAFDAAGVTPGHKGLTETLVRTNIQLAYAAGKWTINQEDSIQEILWGYEYFTVGDDRVRDNHDMLEGTRAPKNDPIWDEIWPPNGYNCRCQVIEVFDSSTPVPAPEGAGADKDFDFNSGKIFGDMGVGPLQEIKP